MTGTTGKTAWPTRKWWATQATAIAGWLIAVINAGWEVTAALQIMAVTIVAQAVTGWLVTNADGPVRRRR